MELHDLFRDAWQTGLVFMSLLVFTRFLGKTQVGQLTFYEYISGITIGSIAGNIVAAEQDKFIANFYDLILFILLTYLLSLATMNRSLRHLIEGVPTIIIENGVLLKQNMKKMRYDLDELFAQLRQEGILDISEVQFAIFETTGDLSVIPYPAAQPVTKKDMSLPLDAVTLPIELIMDGEIIQDNLTKHKITQNWLETQIALRGIKNQQDIFYAAIDSKGHLFISTIPH